MQSYPALTRRELAWTLVALVLIFLFVNGPVWKGPWDATPSIVWSYVPIPFVVAALLWRHRRFKPVPWLLHTLELTVAKFMVTALFLLVLWMSRGGPPPFETRRAEPAPVTRAAPKLPAPTPVPPGELRTVSGRVVDASGAPVAGVLVMVWSGLEGLVFAPRPEPVSLTLAPEGYSPRVIAVQVGQPLTIQSQGQVLHTAQVIEAQGGGVFNIPVLAKGEGAKHVFYKPHGEAIVRCTVHGKREKEATLYVLGHPFSATSGPDGAFTLTEVPRTVRALRAVGEAGSVVAEVPPEGPVTLTLRAPHPL